MANTEKKSIFSRIKKFFKDYKSEIKKITWFSKDQTIKSTLVVLLLVIILAIVVGGLDLLFGKGIQLLGGILS